MLSERGPAGAEQYGAVDEVLPGLSGDSCDRIGGTQTGSVQDVSVVNGGNVVEEERRRIRHTVR